MSGTLICFSHVALLPKLVLIKAIFGIFNTYQYCKNPVVMSALSSVSATVAITLALALELLFLDKDIGL